MDEKEKRSLINENVKQTETAQVVCGDGRRKKRKTGE